MKKTLFPPPSDLFGTLLEAQSEADVRQAILAELPLGRLEFLEIDYLHENLLIEFKFDHDMSNREGKRAGVLAQACYYCHALRINGERVSHYIALVDKNEVILYQREKLESIYKDESLFKKGNPSSPDTAVVELCKNVAPVAYHLMDTEAACRRAIRSLADVCSRQVFKVEEIDEYNVTEAFSGWCNTFDQYMQNISTDTERPHVFEIDATTGGKIAIIYGSTAGAADEIIRVEFNFNGEIKQIENCKRSLYEDFWNTRWKRVTDKKKQREIFAKIYDLMDTASRRRKGQFYTITPLAQRGWEYIVKELGEGFWKDGTWRIWENSAGQGGLVINVIPDDALQYTYLSTIDNAEVGYLKTRTFGRKIFRFDFVNQLTSELPPELQRDMKDPNIKWLFFINPPYGEGSSGYATEDTAWFKKGVSQTLIRERMGRYGMLRESKEKYAQFIFRIQDEFKGKFILGLYSSMKALVSKEYAQLRKFWKPQFKRGFICCAGKWKQSAANGQFPIAFSVLDSREKGNWGTMTYDILEHHKTHAHGIFNGQKNYTPEDTTRSFRQYFFPSEKLPKDELTVVQSNGLKTYGSQSKAQNYRPAGTLAVGGFISGYVKKHDMSNMLSGIMVPNNVPIYINKKNFKRVLCGFGLTWSVRHTWVNHEDCILAPSRELKPREKTDAILYALLSERNRCTTAMLAETEINTAQGKVRNGGLVRAMLNPFDTELFDWKHLSAVGKRALEEYRKYCYEVVNWENYPTAAGVGVWGGHFLYERTKNGLDIENKKPGDGFPLPKAFKDAREALRIEVEKLALDVCF